MKILSSQEEKKLDTALRPMTWEEYIGQEKIKRNIQITIRAAKERGENSLEHILFYGMSGLGKTTISCLIAEELQSPMKIISGPSLGRPGDLAAILTSLSEGEVLFIDEIHRLNKLCEEMLYPALESFKLNLILGKGPMAQTAEINLPKFTLIGATTRAALLSSPLRNRFGSVFQLEFYKNEEIEEIIKRSARIINVEAKEEAVKIIAKASRFTPRIANRLLKRVRDYAQVKSNGIITKEMAKEALLSLEIDDIGLEPGDRKILKAIIDKFNGGPVGLQSLASSSMEDEQAILDIYEPYLMQIGFIKRTPQGRIATKLAYKHLDKK
ncbi:MAG: Holliday junction branch migration DNA helicase RuvB [Candidatus Pacebacteria bacterium]|jgi:Holliday junction DNA helicase RuvB|nr:Holliday junction branch migration DNA helicase RuvB [Candidatus Paceibacterota bacterium]MDD3072584.1 Holliday junction branch migration DNA helicase RuvB [Candidatus Paceibacterota bacterium]MDD3729169.1 Holliday junction branch migration DNA helicase RuvB [Candidatus Paceibacterota bacterium]MDD4201735.1 Holliday junction branch migration DNA helicase RuvB [Candidatus Paceibacterota bacterium]MDD4467173.1 Holliday junction branch migration DNA helicase RuvB [Candidatus Paceibacterota bact